MQFHHGLMEPAIELLVCIMFFVLLRNPSCDHLFERIENTFFDNPRVQRQKTLSDHISINGFRRFVV